MVSTDGGATYTIAPMGTTGVSMGFWVPTNQNIMMSETVLLHVTVNPTLLVIRVPAGGSTVALSSGTQTTNIAPVAYVTLIKISN